MTTDETAPWIVATGVIGWGNQIRMKTVDPLTVALVHAFSYRAEVRLRIGGDVVAAGGIDDEGRFFVCELGEFFADSRQPPDAEELPAVLVVDLLDMGSLR